MYEFELKEELEKKLKKIYNKNLNLYEIIMKKIQEIIINPHHYKNLRAPLNHLKRVHIDTNFVLVFSVNDNSNLIILEDFDHHDNIYKNN